MYEVSYDLGTPYLQWEEGMYSSFDLGVPAQEQQPLRESPLLQARAARGAARFIRAGFQGPVPQPHPTPTPRPPSQPRPTPAPTRSWARCSFAPCAFFGVGCVVVNILDAETLAGPCFAWGCGASMSACMYGTIYH